MKKITKEFVGEKMREYNNGILPLPGSDLTDILYYGFEDCIQDQVEQFLLDECYADDRGRVVLTIEGYNSL